MNGYEEFKAIIAANGRLVEGYRYQKILLDALNAQHDHGAQNAFAVLEGLARVLAQLTAAMPEPQRHGSLNYVMQRANELAPEMLATGAAARHEVEQ